MNNLLKVVNRIKVEDESVRSGCNGVSKSAVLRTIKRNKFEKKVKSNSKSKSSPKSKAPKRNKRISLSDDDDDDADCCIICFDLLPEKLTKKNSVSCIQCKKTAHLKCAVIRNRCFTCGDCDSDLDYSHEIEQ